MSEQYFSANPSSHHEKKMIVARFGDKCYRFYTDAGVFSKDHLDTGTRVLLKAVERETGSRILDLGCGYGPLGIIMGTRNPGARVDLVDTNERAVDLTRENIGLNQASNCRVYLGEGFTPLPEGAYDLIISNPPIRAGKKVVYRLLEDSYGRLETGGRLYVVIRTSQGAKSLEKKLREIYQTVTEVEIESGFRVYRAEKR